MSITKRMMTLSALAGLAFGLAMPAMAQMSAAIKGQVLGNDGKPVEKAEVILALEGSKDTFKTKTDKKGDWGYFTLPQGTFDVSVALPGGQPTLIQKGVQANGGSPVTVNANFEAMAAGVDAPPPGMTKEQADEYEKKVKEQEEKNQKLGKLNVLLQQNKAFVDAKQYDQAIAVMEQAVSLDQTHDILYANLADDYADAKQYDKAADAYNKAIALAPRNAGYVINLGTVLSKEGKIDDANAAFSKAAQMDPTQAKTALYNEAVVLFNQGNTDAAVAAFTKLIELDPTNADAYYYKGLCLLGKSSTDPKTNKIVPLPGTVESLEKAIQLNPNGPNAATAKQALATIQGGGGI